MCAEILRGIHKHMDYGKHAPPPAEQADNFDLFWEKFNQGPYGALIQVSERERERGEREREREREKERERDRARERERERETARESEREQARERER